MYYVHVRGAHARTRAHIPHVGARTCTVLIASTTYYGVNLHVHICTVPYTYDMLAVYILLRAGKKSRIYVHMCTQELEGVSRQTRQSTTKSTARKHQII